MGADIDLVVERREGDGWVRVPLPRTSEWGHPLTQRNYPLFGILANHPRNGYDIPFIAETRGLPPDFAETPCDTFDCEHEPLGSEDGHEPHGFAEDYGLSWVTLAELDAYPWEQALAAVEGSDWEDQLRLVVDEAIPWLHTLGPASDVRLVFGFD